MDSQFRRILGLVRKTGDRMIVTDSNGKDIYVVMGLDQYEDVLDQLSSGDQGDGKDWNGESIEIEEPAWPKVSSDNPVYSTEIPIKTPPRDIFDAMPAAGSEAETWDVSKMNQAEMEAAAKMHEQFERREPVRSNQEISEATPALPPKNSTPDTAEDQYYLEPIE